ncbi:hypothetical protein [Aliivibrio wodanis]|uniref:hypothetical protein n=1 Tax=Aliivibrio wodanis TaxID=80852 RepID=UPI00406C4B2C
MMQWEKLGLIYNVNDQHPWMYSHAAVPIAEHLEGDLYKIYFSSRCRKSLSYTTYITVDLNEPATPLYTSSNPVLKPGDIGEFDDCGAMGSWIVNLGIKKYFYYIGWNLSTTVPFRNSIGLASSTDSYKYERVFKGPVIDRTKEEPHFCASNCILIEDGLWKMWYLACVGWKEVDDNLQHKYHIRYATSQDGIEWNRDGTVAIDFLSEDEYAISRPCVLKDGNLYKMWYSFRGKSYRIGYAESTDGIKWIRKDSEVGIDVSVEGWDSEMIEYPYVFKHKSEFYMLYNGNGYGKTGFGLAVLKNE